VEQHSAFLVNLANPGVSYLTAITAQILGKKKRKAVKVYFISRKHGKNKRTHRRELKEKEEAQSLQLLW
jgi:ribosomal protein L21